MAQALLNGQVDTRDQDITNLEAENADLRDQVRTLELELSRTKRENQRAISELRRMTTPFLNALLAIHGQMDAIGGADNSSDTSSSSSKWEAVKSRLQPRQRDVIDVLLIQGKMSRQQIASAIKANYTNCTNNIIGPLIRQGWLIDNGRDGVSLKEL